MALTETEYQNIVNAVLSAIRTNSRTIDQLTPVTNISTKDFFEIGGGRKISFGLLRQLIISLNSEDYGPLLELVESMKDSIGEPNGLVQLDESGKIASRFLPSYVDDIVEFTEMLNGLVDPLFCEELPEEYASLPNEGTGNDIVLKWVAEASAVNVFYLPDEQRFICGRRAKIMRGDTVIKDIILTAPNKFFAEFGFDVVGGLATPLINKIYVDLSDRKWYRWSGNALVEMPKNVELGEQAGMAYPGNLGTSNRESIANLQASVTLLQEALAQLGNGGNDYKDSVGKPDGLCPLDETGHVASRYLPSYVDDIVEISGIIENNGFSVNFVVEDEYPEFYTELKNDPSQWPEVYVHDRDYLGAKSIYFVRNGAYFACGQITELIDRETGEAVEITLVKAPDVDWASMGFEDYGGSARPCVSKIYYNWEDENMYRWTNFSLRAIPGAASGDPSGTCAKCDENEQRINQVESQVQEIYTAMEEELIPAFVDLINASSEASAVAQSAEEKASEALALASRISPTLKLISDCDAVALNDDSSQPVGLTGKKRYKLGANDSMISTDRNTGSMHIVLPCDTKQIGRRVLLTDSQGLFSASRLRIVVSAEDGGLIGGLTSADVSNTPGKWVEVYGGMIELICTYSTISGSAKPAWAIISHNATGIISINRETNLSKLNEEYWKN